MDMLAKPFSCHTMSGLQLRIESPLPRPLAFPSAAADAGRPANLADWIARPAGEESRLALLGHVLRAAVSDIIGGLRLIEPAGLDEPIRLQLERIRAASEVLALLLEDGLAAMVGEAVTDPLPVSLPLTRLLHDVEMRWSGRAREKGLAFSMTITPDVPRVVALDRIALERILSNVLSNAVKYTDTGGIEVGVMQNCAGDLVFRVRDDGPGFCPDALEHLFEFANRPNGTRKAGSGLGLHITKQMSDRIGAAVWVTNRPEGGAEVMLTLPVASWLPKAGPPEATDGLPDLGRMKVLVAEDSETNQTILRHMLNALGAEVVIVSDGIEALNRLEGEAFDLALIDIEMPRLSGIEVMRAIRADGGRHATMPVMAVTAYVLRANREAIYAAGADSILAKPVGGLDTFGTAIANLLQRTGGDGPAPEADEESPSMDTGRFQALLEIAGTEGRAELLGRLLADLQTVERGLVQGLAEPDRGGIRSQTHVLIAVAGAVGANRLMQVARTLNSAAHRHDMAAVVPLGQEALALLDDLIHFVSGQIYPTREAS